MYKLLMLGTMIGVGVAIAKFIKRKKENTQVETPADINQQSTPSIA